MYEFFIDVLASAIGSLIAGFVGGIYWERVRTRKRAEGWKIEWKARAQQTASIILPFLVCFSVLLFSSVYLSGIEKKAAGIKPFKVDGSEWNETDRWRITECKRVSIEFARQQARNPRRADRRDALSHFKGCVKSHGFGFEECVGADENCQTFVGEMRRRGWL